MCVCVCVCCIHVYLPQWAVGYCEHSEVGVNVNRREGSGGEGVREE